MEQTENAVDTMCALPDEAFELINEYNLACTAAKEAEARKEAAKAELAAMLGSNQIGIYADLKVSYVPQTKVTVDGKKLEKDYPEIYKKYLKSTEFMSFRISHIK